MLASCVQLQSPHSFGAHVRSAFSRRLPANPRPQSHVPWHHREDLRAGEAAWSAYRRLPWPAPNVNSPFPVRRALFCRGRSANRGRANAAPVLWVHTTGPDGYGQMTGVVDKLFFAVWLVWRKRVWGDSGACVVSKHPLSLGLCGLSISQWK